MVVAVLIAVLVTLRSRDAFFSHKAETLMLVDLLGWGFFVYLFFPFMKELSILFP